MGKRGASSRGGGGGGGGGRGGRGGKGGKKDGFGGGGGGGGVGRGPRLHSKLLKELGGGRKPVNDDKDDDALVVKDLYEYEERVAEEEAGKNRRFDAVDGVEYELPSDFEDEEIDEDTALGEEDDDLEETIKTNRRSKLNLKKGEIDLNSEEDDSEDNEEESEDEDEDEDEGDEEDDEDEEADKKHQQMLEAVAGKSKQATQESAKVRKKAVRSEAYAESEYNINPDGNGSASGTNNVSVEELLGSLQGTSGLGALRKRMQPLQKEKRPISVPLPKVIQERVERKVGYEKSRDEVTKWVPLVKQNREASTLTFNERERGATATVAALADKFKPLNDMEKEVALLLKESQLEMKEAQAMEALELNKLGVEEVRERQERLSKMRSLLFQHEAKAKRVAKIKSKTFHRLDKDRKMRDFKDTDEEAVKEAALKQEASRVEERMTLKHKNTSRWAKRILKRGLKAHEDGTRDAILEQLRAHSMLTKKVQSATMSSSDESSSEDDEEDEEVGTAGGRKSKILAKSKAATLEALQFDTEAEIPKSGLFALPFMARAMEKKRNEAREEAVAVLEQLEQTEADDEMLERENGSEYKNRERESEGAGHSGRMAFGDMVAPSMAGNVRKKSRSNMDNEDVDLELPVDDEEEEDDEPARTIGNKRKQKVEKRQRKRRSGQKASADTEPKKVGLKGFNETSEDKSQTYSGGDSIGTVQGLQQSEDLKKTTTTGVVQVSTFNKETGFKSSQSTTNTTTTTTVISFQPEVVTNSRQQGGNSLSQVHVAQNVQEVLDYEEDDFAKDTGLEPLSKNTSQQELIRRAFAGDDVEADFKDTKARAMDEEVVRVEEPKSLPGWGQWTRVQKKRVQPGWQADLAKKKRDEALKNRKDAKLQYVIVSEKLDKKGVKYLASKVPFPMKTKEVFEKTMRMPIGREFNSEKVFRDMIRPAEIRSAGVIIDPIKKDNSAKRESLDVASHVVKRRRQRLEKGSK